MHGSFEDDETWVFSEDEYQSFELEKQAFVIKLRQLFLEYSCLFVGYSLSDPDFKQVFHWVAHQQGGAIGEYRRSAYALVYRADDALKVYWEKKSLHVLTMADVAGAEEKLRGMGRFTGNEPLVQNAHQRFLHSSLGILRVLKEPSPLLDSVAGSRQGARATVRATLLNLMPEVMQELSSGLHSLQDILRQSFLQGSGTPVRKLKQFRERPVLEVVRAFVDSVEAVIQRLREEDLDRHYAPEIAEVLLGVTRFDSQSDEQIWSMLCFLAESVKESGDLKDRQRLEFLAGYYHTYTIDLRTEHHVAAWNAPRIIPSIRAFYRIVRRLPDSDRFPPRLDFVAYALLSGDGYSEERLVYILRRVLRIRSWTNEWRRILDYRLCIACLYCGYYLEVRRILKQNQRTWSRLWNGFLWYSLGDFDRAHATYRELKEDHTADLRERYLAAQAERMIFARDWRNFEETEKRRLQVQKDGAFFRREVQEKNQRIDSIDFIEQGEGEQNRAFRIASRWIQAAADRQRGTTIYNASGHVLQIVHDVSRRWLAGIPLTWFPGEAGTVLLREGLNSGELSVFGVLEQNQLWGVIDEWKKTSLRDQVRRLGGAKGIVHWQRIQQSALGRLEGAAAYLMEHSRPAYSVSYRGRVVDTVFEHLHFFEEVLPYLSQVSLNRLTESLRRILQHLGDCLELSQGAHLPEIGRLIERCFQLLPLNRRMDFLQGIPDDILFGHHIRRGVLFLSEKMHVMVWETVSATWRKKILSAIESAAIDIKGIAMLGDAVADWTESEQERFAELYEQAYEQFRTKQIEYSRTQLESGHDSLRDHHERSLKLYESRQDPEAVQMRQYRLRTSSQDDTSTIRAHQQQFVNLYLGTDLANGISESHFRDLARLAEQEVLPEIQEQLSEKIEQDIQSILSPRYAGLALDLHGRIWIPLSVYFLRIGNYEAWFSIMERTLSCGLHMEEGQGKQFRVWLEEDEGRFERFRRLFFRLQGNERKKLLLLYQAAAIHVMSITKSELQFVDTLWHLLDQSDVSFVAVLIVARKYCRATRSPGEAYDPHDYLRNYDPEVSRRIPSPWHASEIVRFCRFARPIWKKMDCAEKFETTLETIRLLEYPKTPNTTIRLDE